MKPHNTEWQPIDTAPRDGTPFLLYCPGVNDWNRIVGMPEIIVGLWHTKLDTRGPGWFGDLGDVDQGYESTVAYFVREYLSPTHWMPLPEPPK